MSLVSAAFIERLHV